MAKRLTCAPVVTPSNPSCTMDASKLVPPMSMVMKLSLPCAAA